MKYGYEKPFSFQMGPHSPLTAKIARLGVTEIVLSDGRLVRASLHVKSVSIDPDNPENLEVSYQVASEIISDPDLMPTRAHETVQ